MITEWRIQYVNLIDLCRSVDYLFCSLTGGALKIEPWARARKKVLFDEQEWQQLELDSVLTSTFALSVVAGHVGTWVQCIDCR